jgi:hypothetical protein
MRRDRGYGVNPWKTHSRFVVSHHLLRDEAYASPLRDWLRDTYSGSMLILDEAHNAAPASGTKYAVDSQFTKSIRELAPLFEHRLFLSATPHNGHSNSFSSLLEILDPQRFCRGVPVESHKQLEPVMVRRLKDDLRRLEGGFPERLVVEVPIADLAETDPELLLPALLDEYRQAREERLKGESKSVQAASSLVLCSLQKRLLSSIEAFARTLSVHRKAFEAQVAKTADASAKPKPVSSEQRSLLTNTPGPDDDRSDEIEEAVDVEEEAAMEAATEASVGASPAASFERERRLLARMTDLASQARGLPDARVKHLVRWAKAHPDQRALIFTEYADTKGYLERQLRGLLTAGRANDPMIATFHGGMGDDAREEVKRAFNADPKSHPLRILIATDAAREGVNLQNNCADLFHFDVPWNPSRLEQRNGRIDRKLQRAEQVRCHYFVYEQRPEDRVLKALVEKTKIIRRQLGSLAPVVEAKLEKRLESGFARKDAESLADAIRQEQLEAAREKAVQAELEAGRKRDKELKQQIADLQDLLQKSSDWLRIDKDDLRQAISCGLELVGGKALESERAGTFSLPDALGRLQNDLAWTATLDTLRAPRRRGQPPWEWRRTNAVRPVVFEDAGSLDADVVHLHLEHRFVQRLLGRFRSQGFVHDDLARACVGVTSDPTPRVILLGRLSLYGDNASRLHDEVLAVAARWMDADVRKESLRPYADATLDKTMDLLDRTLSNSATRELSEAVRRRVATGARRDLDELKPHLESVAKEEADRATSGLADRGRKEADDMRAIIEAQRARIEKTSADRSLQPSLFEDELRQLQADQRYWERRIEQLKQELETEPARIRKSYEIRATRFEPVGLVYLWPVTG